MSFKFFKFFFFLLIGLFLLKWVYDFFGSPDSIKLITCFKDSRAFMYEFGIGNDAES